MKLPHPKPRFLPARRLLAASLAALGLLVQPALATWSIVVVNTRTNEVAVASATCLVENLDRFVPLVRVGYGVAATQSSIDANARNRRKIWAGYIEGLTPIEILEIIKLFDPGFEGRQIGMVDLVHPPLTFTGRNAGLAAPGVAGEVGELRYAIQGNVLAGDIVVFAAEQALISAPGDLGQKVMAAMEAARSYGGDGRCSCSSSAPTSCGAPPPSFTKTAHSGFVILARIGDVDGVCEPVPGCANGEYYLFLNVTGQLAPPDPVFELQDMYDAWRASWSGRPDQILSEVSAGAQALPADGLTTTEVRLRLVDIDGVPLAVGGAAVSLAQIAGPPGAVVPGAAVDHGDGTYTVPITAGTAVGTSVWRTTVTDSVGDVVLQPDITIRTDPPAPLHVGFDQVSASLGAQVPFVIDLGPAHQGQRYLLLGSASGTSPGTPFAGTTLPLNRDRLFILSRTSANQGPFQQTAGPLDALGRALPELFASPAFLATFAGRRLDWAAVVAEPAGAIVAGPVGFDVTP